MHPIFRRWTLGASAEEQKSSGTEIKKTPTPSASSSTFDSAFLRSVVGVIIGAIIGACGTYFVRSDLDSKALTVQQFQYYHSEAMIKARTTAWDYLTGEYIKEAPRRPLSYWYEDRGDKENARYGAITQVVHYWHLMGVLHQQGFIVPDLARSLLRQHYVEWESALVPLLKASQNDNLDAQNLVKMMSWIKVPDPLTRGTNQRHGRAPARS